jgi:2-methylcitrate dehydratase
MPNPTTPTLAEKIANWAAPLDFPFLPAPVVHEVKRRVIDSIGCAYGAWNADPCTIARRVATRFSASPGATIFGTTHRAPPDWAAFANGCHVRYLDFNDTYLSKEPAHPSDNITAALAVAESQNRTGRELITAIAIAYELQCRLCDAASIRSRGWDHVTYGAFSAALAAAKLLHCPEEKIRHALGIAGVNSPNLRQSRAGELSHWKGCAFANAARHGVYSALLASESMTGPAPIFEGVFGFEKLVSGPLKLAGPIEDNSNDFMIVKTHIKFWPAEYHSQSAIEAALELRKQIKSVEEIESITIESHDASVDIIGSSPEQWKPPSRETADHSLPYITAVALADGQITDRQFAPTRYTNPELLKLVARVKVVRNAELSAKYPREVGNIVTLRTTAGKTLTKRVDVPLGNALKPLTDDQVLSKFHSQSDPIIGNERAAHAADWVWKLESQKNIADLMPLLQVK